MIILGVILLVVGLLLHHPLITYVGVALILIGVLLWLLTVPGPIGAYWY